MSCTNIRKKIQYFFDDLLSDEEYEAYVQHMSECVLCKAHVRSIGDLSNQLWKLGHVKLPPDLAQTAIYEWKHAGGPAPEEPVKTSIKKWAFWTVAIVLACSALIAAAFHHREGSPSTPTVLKEAALESALLSTNDTPISLQNAPLVTQSPSAPPLVVPPPADTTPTPVPAPAEVEMEIRPYHWHVVYLDEEENVALSRQRQEIQDQINRQLTSLRDLQSDIQKAESGELSEIGVRKVNERASRIEKESQLLHALRIEYQTILARENQKIDAARLKITNTLRAYDFRIVSQASDLVIASGNRESMEKPIQDILLLCKDTCNIKDYSVGKTDAGANKTVSVFFDAKDAKPHWHFYLNQQEEKQKLFSAVREQGASVAYESPALAVFLVPKTDIDKLRKKLKDEKFNFMEFGTVQNESQGILSNAPEAISVYFEK